MRVAVLLMAVALVAQPGAAMAQAKPKVPPTVAGDTPPLPSETELQSATDTLSLFVSALNSAEIPADTKAGLLLCLYANPLGKITRGETKVFATNKTLDPTKPGHRLQVLSAICHAPVPKLSKTGKP